MIMMPVSHIDEHRFVLSHTPRDSLPIKNKLTICGVSFEPQPRLRGAGCRVGGSSFTKLRPFVSASTPSDPGSPPQYTPTLLILFDEDVIIGKGRSHGPLGLRRDALASGCLRCPLPPDGHSGIAQAHSGDERPGPHCHVNKRTGPRSGGECGCNRLKSNRRSHRCDGWS